MTRGKADQVAMLIEPRHCVLCEIDEAQYQHCSLDGADPTGHDFVSGCERFRSKGYIEGPVGAPPVHESGISCTSAVLTLVGVGGAALTCLAVPTSWSRSGVPCTVSHGNV